MDALEEIFEEYGSFIMVGLAVVVGYIVYAKTGSWLYTALGAIGTLLISGLIFPSKKKTKTPAAPVN